MADTNTAGAANIVQAAGATTQTAPASASALTPEQQALTSTVRQVFTELVEPIRQENQVIRQELNQLRQPQSQSGARPSQLFGGGAPGVRIGESVLTSRGYQFARAIRAMASRDWSSAKPELEIHNKLHQVYGGSLETNGILIPLGGRHLQCVDQQFAAEVAQMVRQGVAGADAEEMGRVFRQAFERRWNQDLSIWDDTAGAVLLGTIQQGEMIDLLRAAEVLSQAGARDITMPPNGRLQFPRHTGTTTGYWVGEGQQITESAAQTGMLTMTVKKLAAISDLPNEMLKFATASVEAFVRKDLADMLAVQLDNALLLDNAGSDVRPKGLLAYTTSGNAILTYTASTVGNDGNTFEPQDVRKMEAKVRAQNVQGGEFVFCGRPEFYAGLAGRRADAVSAGDGKGPFVFITNANQAQGNSTSLHGFRFVQSTQLRATRSKGAASNLTELVGGVFNEYLIGRLGALEFSMDPYAGSAGGTNFRNDITSIRCIEYVTGIPRRPEAFVYCDTLVNG